MTDVTGVLSEGLRGTYLVERPIGEGGMATVYLAQDLKHQRPVALKVLKPELAQNLGPERFRREITTAARLQHPHILSVHDSGETQGHFWFTMPFVEGESLRDRLKRERCLPIDEALRITREAAQALQYAHERGIVHRDIKPENILLTRDGSTLVADFGIARALDRGEGLTTTGDNLTQTGAAIGTPQYMAPEQATGEKGVDARADQYALSAMLYEMLAGEPPFTASSAAALVAKRFTSAVPSVRSKRPEVPAAVDDALQRALALKPDDRFPTMQDFSRAATSLVALSSAEIRALSVSDARTPTPGMGVPATQVTPAAPRPRRNATLLVGIAVLAALGVGGILLARRGRAPTVATETATGAMRLAVLPFENLGDTADAYFADGISDELRGKLTALPGLEVIARSSSVPYRGTTKPPQAIAKELGVRYLLTGTVRWEKSGGGKGRVRVSPELIEVSPSGAPASKWQQPFDAPITDVFQVQGDIAGKVATALNVALGTGQQQVLASRPTENLQAYDAYLRGEAAWGGNSSSGSDAIRSAIEHYEHATALDTGFALAWAQLARASSAAYYNLTPLQRFADRARVASERAVALAPDRPESQLALGDYFSFIHEDDTRALEAYQRGLQMAPADAELLSSAAISEWGLGRFQDSEQHLTKSQTLDPRSVNTLRRLATLELRLRNYTATQGTVERGLALAPTSLTLIELGAMNHLAQGDLPGARQVVRDGLKRVEPASLVAYLSNFFDLYWVLEEPEQRLALQGTPAQYGDDRGTWALVLAQLYHLHGDEARTRAYADTARVALSAQLKDTPDNSARQMALALALAHMGRFPEAIDQGERALARTPPSKDALAGPYYQHQLSRIYLMAGQPGKALDLLEPLLRMPYYLSPGWLKVDPTFVPLRGNPRFEKLAGGS